MPPSLTTSQLRLEQTLATVLPDHPAALALATVADPGTYPGGPAPAQTVDLAEPELATLATFTLPKRRAQWLAGRVCAKQAVIGYLRRFRPQLPLPDARDIVIRNLADGRPEIASPFAGCSHLDLSISHSGAYAAALVSTSPCGIDIQEDSPTLARISDRFCQANEAEILQRHLPDHDSISRLNLLWTAKEAARKAVGRERMPGFLELVLRRCQPSAGDCIMLTLGQDRGAAREAQELTILATRFDHFCLSVVLTHGGNAHA